MNLLEYLAKKQKKRKTFFQGEEYLFYYNNSPLLTKLPQFDKLFSESHDDFTIMRANIILHGLIAKNIIDEEAKKLYLYTKKQEVLTHDDFIAKIKEKLIDSPYYEDGSEKIYIPFFSRTINLLYSTEPERLNEYPYTDLFRSFETSTVDPFDTYGVELYNSQFTRLVKIYQHNQEAAFFHYDTNTIYIINDQGRLNDKIVLFDKYLRNPTYHHMLERTERVAKAYFDNDRQKFVDALLDNNFVSKRAFYYLRRTWKKTK